MTLPGRTIVHRIFGGRRRGPGTPRASEAAKTLLIVVPLTLLIWVYAERAQNRDDVLTTQLAFSVGDPNLSATIDSTETVQVSLNGTRGQIDQLKARVESATMADRHLTLALPNVDASPGDRNIDLTRVFNDDPLIATSGVTVTKTTPSQVRVAVDPVVSREVSVVVPQGLSVTLQNVSFDPPRVSVRGPQPAIRAQFGSDDASVPIDASAVAGTTGEGQRTLDVPLVAPRDPRLVLSPARVKMTFEIGSTVREGTIASVIVDVRRPIGEDGRSKVFIRRGAVINNVQIRGPANLVTPLVGNRPLASVKAVLQVSQDDLGKGEIRRAVQLDLDPAVAVIGGPKEVTFELRDIADADR